MKKNLTRIVSFFIVLILCLSPVADVTAGAAATVTYVYGSASGYSNVIANWGERGTEAEFLSPNAIEFYEDNNVSYSQLAALSGSTSTSAVPSSALYKKLQTLMSDNHSKQTSYEDLKHLFAYSDCENSDHSKLSLLYLGDTVSSTWNANVFNREHCWPKSKGIVADSTKGETADLMTLRPTNPSVNSSRGNKAFGETTNNTYFFPNSRQLYGDDIRGDMARTLLYAYVRWGNTANMWGSNGVIQSREVLLAWNAADPVDTWELGRNDSVESVTGTRNVFIDYPELVFLLLGAEIPEDYESPSGNGGTTAPSYTVTASSNNTVYGTVSVSGNVITAIPNAGYRVAGYQVISGSATVTQSGNTFTVTAQTDCTVQINFSQKPIFTATFLENGSITGTDSAYDTVTLPACTLATTDGYSFEGWVTDALEESNEKPGKVYTPGSVYTITQNTTFHALYSFHSGEGSSDEFRHYTGALTDGCYLLTYSDGALTASINSGNRFDYTGITVSSDTVQTEDTAIVWYVEQQSDGYYTIYNEATGKYAAGTGAKNKGALSNSVTDLARWSVTGTETYEFENLGNHNNGVNDLLHRNGNYGFACYSSSTGGALTLYKQSAGSTVYTTSPETEVATYTVTFLNDDGTVLEATAYPYGTMPVAPDDPTKAADESYTYEFAGWTPELAAVTGDAVYTATYTATEIEKPAENAIVKQPESITVDSGNDVQFSIQATGEVVSYKWEYRKVWKWFNTSMTGYNTDTLTVPAVGQRNGYDYRCTVTFADGTTVVSDPAELTVRTQITDVTGPNDQTVVLGYKGQFTASAQGEGIRYQWQYKRPDGTTWINTAMEGCTKPTVLIETTAARDGYQYRCEITDVTGNLIYTEPATMRVLSFKSHPQETFAATGSAVQLTVTTSVDSGFAYQWQYSKNGTTWSNTTMTGYNTATLTVTATAARNGYQYRCVLTGSKSSKIESKAAVLHVGDPVVITRQPSSVSAKDGTNAIFTVEATNAYAYQWEYRRNTTGTWYHTSATGCQSPQLTIQATTGKNGYQYRCKIYGLNGVEYSSNIVTLVVSG